MKVLVLSHMFPNNVAPSYGVFVYEQIEALNRLGVKTEVISPVPFSPRLLWFVEKWERYGNIPLEENIGNVKALHPRYLSFPKRLMFEKSGWFYYQGIKEQLKKMLETSSFDLVHAHTALPDGQAALYLKRDFGIPYVVTIHGDDLQHTIHEGRLRKESVTKVIIESEKTIVVSSKLKRIIEKHLSYIPMNKIEVIGNGVNVGLFKSLPRRIPKGKKFIILTVGHLKKIKGHTFFLEALGQLVKKYEIEYFIVGEGSERSNLGKIVRDGKLRGVVRFFGYQPHEKIPHFMKEADLFVLPSWNEGFGIVYLEAMASGLPVIGCKGQGIEDFVKNGEEGFLVEPKTSGDLFKACEEILLNPSLYEQMSKKALETVKKFTWQENAKKTTKTYNDILNRE